MDASARPKTLGILTRKRDFCRDAIKVILILTRMTLRLLLRHSLGKERPHLRLAQNGRRLAMIPSALIQFSEARESKNDVRVIFPQELLLDPDCLDACVQGRVDWHRRGGGLLELLRRLHEKVSWGWRSAVDALALAYSAGVGTVIIKGQHWV